MRPRTKIEKQVVEMANAMPPASDTQREWAFTHLFQQTAKYYRKGEVWCLNCGHIEPWKEPELAVSIGMCEYTCPKCGARLKMEHWKGSAVKSHEVAEFSIVTTHNGWQVLRTFEVERKNRRGERTERHMREVFQRWLSPKGKEVIASRAYTRCFYYLRWDYDSDFEIKRHNARASGYYAFNDMFEQSDTMFYPRVSVLPILKRNGWRKRLLRLRDTDPIFAMRHLLTCTDAETMVKTGQLAIFRRMVIRQERQIKHRHAVNICNRNGYIIKDSTMYMDYLDLLEHFNLDTHNAHYVCPENLKTEHDRLLWRKRREEDRKRAEEKRKEAALFEKQYAKRYGKFFGVEFSNKEIKCHVLTSVAEFVEEGMAMHHCVYENGYFDHKRHPNTLILSARDNEGQRIETIEVNLKTLKVVQSRGLMNRMTPKHNQIVELVNNNINLIKKAI